MSHAFASAFAAGARRVAIVGTDVPAAGREHVAEALRSLDDHDVVLGPTHDGGYYLIALDRPRPALFQSIPWSTPSVLPGHRRAGRVSWASACACSTRCATSIPSRI